MKWNDIGLRSYLNLCILAIYIGCGSVFFKKFINQFQCLIEMIMYYDFYHTVLIQSFFYLK